MSRNKVVRPFLKWAGGKRQLLPEIKKYLPKIRSNNVYYEPFLGAGALLFELQPTKAVINDSNTGLISCYTVIKDWVEELILDLKKHKNDPTYYYEIRDWDRSDDYQNISLVEKASRIIYLNKTCYNGLFRVNSQGQFNVPFGKYKNPNILEDAVLRAVSNYLKNNDIKILNTDFQEAVKTAKKGDFVYFDPPYDPVSNTASFTGYDINGFDKNDQKRLKEVFIDLTERGCNVMLSNSLTPFTESLYREYSYIKVNATRNINSNALKRGRVEEILVLNYQP
ncbi:DNA adenine methylase [[Phormidium] sp. LEGE 05292]|uniref:DNA adenine methylase n=1 Tax=[Phormidium] sp. LEGE 05292 TaxID=767427 RepID=UPI002AD2968A|nr:DNA adenine methylase [Phormidium sp. LEGE 05292]